METTAGGQPVQRTILIAEDEPTTRVMLRRILERAGFRVVPVENGRLAIAAVALERPDLVLLDWSMPVMDGREALDVLKADPATRSIPVMMLSSHGEIDGKIVALTAGVQDFITKPVDPRELVARINQQLHWRQLVAGDAAPQSTAERLREFGGAKVNSNLRKAGAAERGSYIEQMFGTTKKRW